MGAILELVDAIPDDLITLSPENHARFLAALGAARAVHAIWTHGGQYQGATLDAMAALLGRDPVTTLDELLRKCPDEAPSAQAPGLAWLSDAQLEESIRGDIDTSHRALGNGEHKAAAVLAGSVIEALLLWALQRLRPSPDYAAGYAVEIASANARRAKTGIGPLKKFNAAATWWSLEQFVAISREAGILAVQTADAADVARDFRNLIHPGKAERTGMKPTRGSAGLAVGAMDRVVEELEQAVKDHRL